MPRYDVRGQLVGSLTRPRLRRVSEIDVVIDLDFTGVAAGTPEGAVNVVGQIVGWDCAGMAPGRHLVVTDTEGNVLIERRQAALDAEE